MHETHSVSMEQDSHVLCGSGVVESFPYTFCEETYLGNYREGEGSIPAYSFEEMSRRESL